MRGDVRNMSQNIPEWPIEAKRVAAIRLLSMCRRRKRDYPFLGELFQRQLP
jgi:hypothetical protein